MNKLLSFAFPMKNYQKDTWIWIIYLLPMVSIKTYYKIINNTDEYFILHFYTKIRFKALCELWWHLLIHYTYYCFEDLIEKINIKNQILVKFDLLLAFLVRLHRQTRKKNTFHYGLWTKLLAMYFKNFIVSNIL